MWFCRCSIYSVLNQLESAENMDLICCLNVLDRCSDPFELLAEIHRALSPKGRAIIALVLPYNHYVETSKSTHVLLLTHMGEKFLWLI